MDVLRRLRDPVAIQAALNELPEDLDEMYERVFMSIPKHDRAFAQKTLEALCFGNESQTEFTPNELVAAVCKALSDSPTSCQLSTVDDLRETCGCLIKEYYHDMAKEDYCYRIGISIEDLETIESNTPQSRSITVISFAHYTVKEYIVSTRIQRSPRSEVSLFACAMNVIIPRWIGLFLSSSLESVKNKTSSTRVFDTYSVNVVANMIVCFEGIIMANFQLMDLVRHVCDPSNNCIASYSASDHEPLSDNARTLAIVLVCVINFWDHIWKRLLYKTSPGAILTTRVPAICHGDVQASDPCSILNFIVNQRDRDEQLTLMGVLEGRVNTDELLASVITVHYHADQEYETQSDWCILTNGPQPATISGAGALLDDTTATGRSSLGSCCDNITSPVRCQS